MRKIIILLITALCIFSACFIVDAAATSLSKTAPVVKCYNSVNGADIRWTKVDGAYGYYIYRYRPADGKKLIGTLYNHLQMYDKEVKTNCWGRVYKYSVVPFDKNKTGKAGEFTFQRVTPTKITGCNLKIYNTVLLKWTYDGSENKVHGYEISYATSQNDLINHKGSYRTLIVSGRNIYQKYFTNLKQNTYYCFRIRSYADFKDSSGKITRTWSQYSSIRSIRTSTPKSKYRALLVGNLEDVPVLENDGDLLESSYNGKTYLSMMQSRLYKYDYISIREEVSANEIISSIRSDFREATERDVSLFYFLGHGGKNGFLSCYNNSRLYESTLVSELNKIPGKKIIILDCCYSGYILTLPEVKNGDFYVITSSNYNERAYSAYNMGYLTKYFCYGLQNITKYDCYADTNRSRKITIKEIFSFIVRKTSITAKQHPQLYAPYSNFVIVDRTR